MSAMPIERLRRSRLRVQQMELVLHLIDRGSISAAADAMGLTQSAVTRSLQDLESLMEVTLFERSHSGVTPTASCRPLETLAREMHLGLEVAARRIHALESGDDDRLRLAAEPGLPSKLLCSALGGLLQEEPSLRVSIRCESTTTLISGVAQGDFDLALVRTDLNTGCSHHRFHALGRHRLRLVCGTRHPLARSRAINARQLAAQRWLLPAADHPVTRRVELAFSQQGVPPPRQRIEADASPCLLPLIADSGAVAAIDEALVQDGLLEHGLFALPEILELAPVTIFAMAHASRPSSSALERLLSRLCQPSVSEAAARRA